MRVVPCVVGVILLVMNTDGFSLESLDDFLVYPVEVPTSIQKRDTWKDESIKTFDKFVEEKLVAHSQALEHILKMTRSNQEYIKQLVENLSNKVSEPKIPEKVEFNSRRSFLGNSKPVPNLQNTNTISPWCAVALLCSKTFIPVCGFDDNFGFGKFDSVCHMLQVNCYWKYNFALVPSCKPSL